MVIWVEISEQCTSFDENEMKRKPATAEGWHASVVIMSLTHSQVSTCRQHLISN